MLEQRLSGPRKKINPSLFSSLFHPSPSYQISSRPLFWPVPLAAQSGWETVSSAQMIWGTLVIPTLFQTDEFALLIPCQSSPLDKSPSFHNPLIKVLSVSDFRGSPRLHEMKQNHANKNHKMYKYSTIMLLYYWILGYHRLNRYHQIYWINSDCTRLFFLKRPTDWKLLQFGQLSILEEEIFGHNSSILQLSQKWFWLLFSFSFLWNCDISIYNSQPHLPKLAICSCAHTVLLQSCCVYSVYNATMLPLTKPPTNQ